MKLTAFFVLCSSLVALRVESAVCAAGVTTAEVASISDVLNLRSALNCTGGGVFDVAWYGTVAVNDTFYVPDGTDMTVTGYSSSSALDQDAGPTATVEGGYRTSFGLFRLSNNSVLSLNNLVLNGGYSTDVGGAIAALGASINIVDCTFRGNKADAGENDFVLVV